MTESVKPNIPGLEHASGGFPKSPFFISMVVMVLMTTASAPAPAQTFAILHTFAAANGYVVNSGGSHPSSTLTLSGNTMYGTTDFAGNGAEGTVFSLNTDGTGFTTVHSFSAGGYNSANNYTNSDGADPRGTSLILSGSTLYGTASAGGSGGWGTVFAVNTDGTGFTTLHSFDLIDDGGQPQGLVLSGDTLYGFTASFGYMGVSVNGTVFALSTNGGGFRTLYAFTGGSDGGWATVLVPSGNILYGGTFSTAGGNESSTLFAVGTDGTGFTTLYSFSTLNQNNGYTNSDGADPAALVLSGSTLYGIANSGGAGGNGTAFAVNTDGTAFKTLYSFTANFGPMWTNSDGANPSGDLVLSANTLYGTTTSGGSSGWGTGFAISTDGTGFTNLHDFASGNEAIPNGLILSKSALYGTTEGSPSNLYGGTVFKLSLAAIPPQLTIAPAGTNVILSWSTNFTGFTLQFATNLVSPPFWTAVSAAPVIINGQNTLTNPITGGQQFYRLVQ